MNTTTLTLGRAGHSRWIGRLGAYDGLFAAAMAGGAAYAFSRYSGSMNAYETWILVASVPFLVGLGWFWGALRTLTLAVGAATLVAIGLYSRVSDGFGADLAQADQVFWLKYFLSSQSAILWMSVLVFMSTVFYWIGFAVGERAAGQANTAQGLGSRLAWAAVFMGLVGTLVRWFESHQIGPDIGHIPVSNLYEVFVLFVWLTTLFHLYFEQHYGGREGVRSLGAFVMLVVSAAVGFLLWYTVAREAHEIQPLVPALQSWWMKLHVPANFVGYGTFAIAAMVAFAYLVKQSAAQARWHALVPLFVLGMVLCLEPVVFRQGGLQAISSDWAVYFGVSALLVGSILAARRRIAARLPSFEVLDDVMYKAIAVGFAFFTIATILGAFWAAEAWGGYWSWDPKETWALIVWLNYAAWLHMRLMKGLRGAASAWWALVGLAITTFAFLGVNMFLSGLHSYGEL
jgi:cytochrome c-type biogenesis protein CcsB